MLENLQKELEHLQTKNQDQGYKLQNLFIHSNTIKNEFQGLYIQIPQPQNLLNKVRPEVFNQILEFVDLKSYLSFRVISKRANQTVIQMVSNRIAQIQQIIMRRESKLQEFMQGYSEDELLQDLYQRKRHADKGLTILSKWEITEMKKLAHPPLIIQTVMKIVCILSDSTFSGENSSWTVCQKIIENIQFFNRLKCLDIENINEKQLKLLQNIHSISEEQVKRVSSACFAFYQYIKAVVEIRESKAYYVKGQKDLIEKLIKRDSMALNYLQKLNA